MAWAAPWVFKYNRLPYLFNLECLGDFQLGSKSTCLWKIKQHIDDILERAKHTDSGVVSVGDLEDEDRPSTRAIRASIAADRSEVVERDAEKHMAWLDRDVIPLLMKLHRGTKYGILGGVAGHHWTQLSPALNSVQYIFGELQRRTGKPCLYLGQMLSFLDFRFQWQKPGGVPVGTRVVGLLQHGEGGGQTKGSTISKLERTVQGFDADFYIRGHDCQLVGTKTDQLFASAVHAGSLPAINSRTKVMLNLGAATMGYELGRGKPSYIEQGMMRPATMGWGTIKFRLRRLLKAEDPNHGVVADMKLEF